MGSRTLTGDRSHMKLGVALIPPGPAGRIAATPVGMKALASARVTGVEGRTVTFQVQARDEKDLIGDGTHQRVIVNVEKFDARVQKKLARG